MFKEYRRKRIVAMKFEGNADPLSEHLDPNRYEVRDGELFINYADVDMGVSYEVKVNIGDYVSIDGNGEPSVQVGEFFDRDYEEDPGTA